MAQSAYFAPKALNFVGGLLAAPALAGRWLALFTTAPTDASDTATEVSGGAYARVQVAGQITTNAGTTTGSPTLHAAAFATWITAGMTVYDATTGLSVGVVQTAPGAGTTCTLVANAANAVTSGDVLNFSIFPAASGSGPSSTTSGAIVTFPQATASWGTVTSWGLYDAASSGNLVEWDFLGNDPWYPTTGTLASPGVFTAIGLTAGSSPTLANGAGVVFTARFGGALPAVLTAGTVYTVAGLSSDTFNVSQNTASTSACMVRAVTSQPIAINVTASFASGALILAAA
jgi:hypothetical protein